MNERRAGGRAWLGWSSALLSCAYIALCHHGLAASSGSAWWQPSGFLQETDWLGDLETSLFAGADVVALALPAAVLCAGAFVGAPSLLARALTLCGVASSALLAFYGLHAFMPWDFFGWRGSVTIIATGFVTGTAVAAPLFAARWLRSRSAGLAVIYAAAAIAIVVLMRHTTGWSEGLRFNLSPWPAIPLFGLDIVARVLAGFYLALGLALVTPRRLSVLSAAAGALGLVAWISLRFGYQSAWVPVLILALLVPLAGATLALDFAARARAGRCLLVAGLALAVPLLTGGALASGDHAHTRHVLAPLVIAGLESYLDREQIYPDTLEELVASQDLVAIPRPRVGFDTVFALGLLEPPKFGYRNLGSSYVLDFSSTEWVQCLYTPPWIDEDEPLEEEETEEPWACPDTRPNLW